MARLSLVPGSGSERYFQVSVSWSSILKKPSRNVDQRIIFVAAGLDQDYVDGGVLGEAVGEDVFGRRALAMT